MFRLCLCVVTRRLLVVLRVSERGAEMLRLAKGSCRVSTLLAIHVYFAS